MNREAPQKVLVHLNPHGGDHPSWKDVDLTLEKFNTHMQMLHKSGNLGAVTLENRKAATEFMMIVREIPIVVGVYYTT